MRNLRNVAYREVTVPDGLPLTASTWDTLNDTSICAFGPTSESAVIELKRTNPSTSDFDTIATWDAPCPLPELACDSVLLLHHFADHGETFLVLEGGDTVVVRERPLPDQEKIEIIGSIDVGISAAAWSPEEELLVFVTRQDTLILVNRNFDPLVEGTLSEADLQASKHVSVGWGKKETQFQGKRARAMKDPTVPDAVDEGKPSIREDGAVSISWRGDGAYFAVNSVVPGHRRVVRVFDREGHLDSASEPVDGLESALCWRPSGNLIAAIKRSESKIEVVFFERNGLRHGEFDLRLTKEQMDTWATTISLNWNIDSTVLAVAFKDRIHLWTMGNYHYYLKQEISILSSNRPLVVHWHSRDPLKLLADSERTLVQASSMSTVSRGPVRPPQDLGAVAVIDGRIMKLTPLGQAAVPPPMAFCEVIFDHNLRDCAFTENGETVVVLTKQTLEVCRWPLQSKEAGNGGKRITTRYSPHVERSTIPLPIMGDASKPHYSQIGVCGNNEAYILAHYQDAKPAELYMCRLDRKELSFTRIETSVNPRSFVSENYQNTLWATSGTGTQFLASTTPTPIQGGDETSLTGADPDACVFQLSVPVPGEPNGYHEPTFRKVSLDSKNTLRADGHVLARDCSSFAVTDAHIIFTTTQHLLKFVHLAEPKEMNVPGDTPEVDERCRSIERGAKIVTAMPSSYAVVLQMPRGNLETIYPRVLVLTGIRRHIANLDYRTAFLACQTHQVDLNILHDYQPENFMVNVPKFVDELRKPARVDEFISKLKEEDVSQTLYRDTLNNPTDNTLLGKETRTATGKVNRICDALISVLSSKPPAFLQNIITAHVCKRPPDLNAALMLVSKLRRTSTEEADMAISHLCFLTDTNRLYDAALALYDLEVTLLVAQNAQRDPREYMPFLQSLHALPELRRQYTIDNHLKNYAKALTSLHALSAHEEAETYTTKHSLYSHALDLYKYSPFHLETITRHYASYLSSQSQHLHAATLYDSLHDYSAAYPLYALAHAWRECLTCATLLPLPPSQLHTLASSLATHLSETTHDYRAAATIHAEYLSSIPTAAKLLTQGSYFADATRLLALHNHTPLITEVIDPSLLDKTAEILSLLTDCRAQLSSQVPRILELRKIKISDPLAFFGGDHADGGFDDTISLAPTDSTLANHSLFTRYSHTSKFAGTQASNLTGMSRKTSKTRRKEERKRARGKKGSVYEEEYLVSSVRRLVERVNGTHDEVRRLISGLVRRGMRERALEVGKAMGVMQDELVKAREEVWGAEDVQDGEAGGRRPRGADGVFWESQQEEGEGQGRKEAPEVKVWKDELVGL
jgi:elongator complex protein 1